MKQLLISIFAILLLCSPDGNTAEDAPSSQHEVVILLHGLARSSRSMARLAWHLKQEGYRVENLDYPSRHQPIEQLAINVRQQIIDRIGGSQKIHIVSHSLGGILIRQIQATSPLPSLARVVMLAPPNHGSEVVDKLGSLSLFDWVNGPAGKQLGTQSNSLPNSLGQPE